jgi:hypothetical protein
MQNKPQVDASVLMAKINAETRAHLTGSMDRSAEHIDRVLGAGFPELIPQVLKGWDEVKKILVEAQLEAAKSDPTRLAPKRLPNQLQWGKNSSNIEITLVNTKLLLKTLGAECSYDLFLDQPIIKGIRVNGNDGASGNINAQYAMARNALCELGYEAPKELVVDAIKIMCWDNCFNPVLDYLDGLQWDGVSRLDQWLITYCGADDTPFNRAVARKTLIAAVRRVRSPGCKFDYITSLEGLQGMGKSTLLRILAGEYFTDTAIIGVDSKRQQENVQGVWIYELAELVRLNKTEVREVKVFASQTHDKARKPYDREVTNAPRKCIFVATTNDDKYLRDTTGNRRWWPVKIQGIINGPIIDGVLIKLIDLEAVARDRDQLWAEACIAEASGEPLEIPQTLWADATAIQLARMEEDPWDDILAAAIAFQIASRKLVPGKFGYASDSRGAPVVLISSAWLLDQLEMADYIKNPFHTKHLAEVMSRLGYEKDDSPLRIAGLPTQSRGYRKLVTLAQNVVSLGGFKRRI